MKKSVDIVALQDMMQDALKIDQLRSGLKNLSEALRQVNRLQDELQKILEGKPGGKAPGQTKKGKGKKGGKQPYPKPGSAPGRLCSILGAEPKSVKQIAKEAGWTEGTTKVYLHQFGCFQNVKGKGYVHNSQVHGKQEIKKTVVPKVVKKSKKKTGK